ncbi:hypothetical protein [Gordonia paraffinivorans]|uniref:Uncharacterized protein n=2 Tax=Gordonia paraffinivorans TaxID=175628 RepID=A0ABQ0ILL5_9ACTN|nr:hypothetical protein [Gordonia paraffinivorans]MBY4574038.1 hypothetical protein [Gordonia paraffinivorans]MCD2144023.1 hypothetical protein [Gordonia paraffinivorans]PWD42181.1 hypothetical protein ACN93_15440 [Gordonia paraffinivorans]VFA82955.1 Uncharacterised protein [Gordonia paraffinivorans]GAC84454.1 hypothetical protein GP2_022_00700 [Gordonia paraffinivorans NBRC 108238]
MTRDVYVEDLVPGDRIRLDGTPRVVRTTSRLDDDRLRIELVKGHDDLQEVILDRTAKLQVN